MRVTTLRGYLLILVLLLVLTLTSTLLFAQELDLVLSSNTPTDQGDSIILSLTNNSSSDVTIEGTVTIDFNGNVEELQPDEHSYIGSLIIAAGETEEIAEIAPGMPGSWRGFYGEGPYMIKIWVDVFEIIESWESNVVSHSVIVPQFDPGEVAGGEAEFLSDNQDGTATILITAIDGADDPVADLGANDFIIGDPESDPPEGVGTIVSVTETEPGIYEVVWDYEDGQHKMDIWVSGRQVASGLDITISTVVAEDPGGNNDDNNGEEPGEDEELPLTGGDPLLPLTGLALVYVGLALKRRI